ncbi:hypothetical protein AB0J80_30845 [Actinoplanes sp. NPDC049548]|uniref:hypothetical protein n=1 Tax=Actinoplanes sp. NPDC049548 TaxID=3155152 RepID=UPI003429DD13
MDSEPRVYRHVPWLVLTSCLAVGAAAIVPSLVAYAVRNAAFEPIVKTVVGVTLLLGFVAFLLLNWRIRTVVDDRGVTQHWISSSYRIPYEDITALETDEAAGRWFLRIHCGERTFEAIPCHRAYLLPFAGRPPRALTAVRLDIESSVAASGQ